MSIEKKLERVMKIGREIESCRLTLDGEIILLGAKYFEIHQWDRCLALWLELNKIEASIRANQKPPYKPKKEVGVDLGICAYFEHPTSRDGETYVRIGRKDYCIRGCVDCAQDFIRKKRRKVR